MSKSRCYNSYVTKIIYTTDDATMKSMEKTRIEKKIRYLLTNKRETTWGASSRGKFEEKYEDMKRDVLGIFVNETKEECSEAEVGKTELRLIKMKSYSKLCESTVWICLSPCIC